MDFNFYKENGYLIIPEFLSEMECIHLQEEADKVVKGEYSNVLNIHLMNESFFKLITDPDLLGLCDKIQNHRMIPIGSIFFFCKPNNPLENGSNMHQDNYAAKAPLWSYFVCGVALDDCDEENGSLIVYPGSHRLGDLTSEESKNFEFDNNGKIVKSYPIGNKVNIPEGYEAKQLKYSKGSLILIHGNIIHGAPKNLSPNRWRRMVYLHYIKDGDPFWPGWNAKRRLIDRNKSFEENLKY